MIRAALISEDGKYRYTLSRRWAPGRRILWIMLNPSTADAAIDDPTIRRCIGFSRAWGFGSMEVGNLFALRTADPAQLRMHPDPVGPGNDAAIARALSSAAAVILAWGACAWALKRADLVRADLVRGACRGSTLCLGLTQGGHPRHPLYVRADTEPALLGPARLNASETRSLARGPHPCRRAIPSPSARLGCRV